MTLRLISYLPKDLILKHHSNISYFFEVDRRSMPVYFGLKGKHDYSIINYQTFIECIKIKLNPDALYVIPESSSSLLIDILGDFKYIILKKQSKSYIKESLLGLGFSKIENLAINNWFNKMGNDFNIHQLKTNKRYATIPYLFKEQNINQIPIEEIVLFDDICVSGTTLKSIEYLLDKQQIPYKKLVLFLDKDYKGC